MHTEHVGITLLSIQRLAATQKTLRRSATGASVSTSDFLTVNDDVQKTSYCSLPTKTQYCERPRRPNSTQKSAVLFAAGTMYNMCFCMSTCVPAHISADTRRKISTEIIVRPCRDDLFAPTYLLYSPRLRCLTFGLENLRLFGP